MLNLFKKENKDFSFDIINIDELENRPLTNREFLIVKDYEKGLSYYYLDHTFQREFLGMKVDNETLQGITDLLNNSKAVIHDSEVVEGKIELLSGHKYYFTTYLDINFSLPLVNDSNYHDDIVVELAYNKGNVDLGSSWKTTSNPINGMGVYFITYKYSRSLKNWVASIELVSD